MDGFCLRGAQASAHWETRPSGGLGVKKARRLPAGDEVM